MYFLHNKIKCSELHIFDQLKSLMLRFRHNVKVFFVDILILTASIDALNPCVVPVRIDFLTSYIYLAVFQCKKSSIFAETHVQTGMKAKCQLSSKQSAGRHWITVLHLPATMLRPWMPRYVPGTGSGFFAGKSNWFWNRIIGRITEWNIL